jgi:hypothetical protein
MFNFSSFSHFNSPISTSDMSTQNIESEPVDLCGESLNGSDTGEEESEGETVSGEDAKSKSNDESNHPFEADADAQISRYIDNDTGTDKDSQGDTDSDVNDLTETETTPATRHQGDSSDDESIRSFGTPMTRSVDSDDGSYDLLSAMSSLSLQSISSRITGTNTSGSVASFEDAQDSIDA